MQGSRASLDKSRPFPVEPLHHPDMLGLNNATSHSISAPSGTTAAGSRKLCKV